MNPANFFIKQKGSVLLISLVLMAAISLLGLSAMHGTLTNEKIASHLLDSHIANEAAASALRIGQTYLKTGKLADIGLDAVYATYAPGVAAPNLDDWNTRAYTVSATELDLSDAQFDTRKTQSYPQLRVEEYFREKALDIGHTADAITRPLDKTYYRVIARGIGLSGKNETIIETSVVTGLR